MVLTGENEILLEKLVTLCPPEISHDLTCVLTRVSAMGGCKAAIYLT